MNVEVGISTSPSIWKQAALVAGPLIGIILSWILWLSGLELDQAMGEMDADGSGEADFEEFHTWWVNVGDEKSKWALLLDAKDDRRERELRAAFEYV